MDVYNAIRLRRSVRAYRSDPIPPDVVRRITEAMRAAPSACNYQPWRFVLIRDPLRRAAVAAACAQQHFMAQAPLIVAACVWPARSYPRMGGYWPSADVDAAIALDHLMLAAAAEGLGTCWIGAFDENEVKRLLRVPPEVKIVGLTPVGYPERPELLRPLRENDRKPRREVIVYESWDGPPDED